MPAAITLYLIRHAIAADRGDAWPDDSKRPLTHKGVTRMREIVSGLGGLKVEMDGILSSPLVRARQTADIIVAGLDSAPALVITAALAPGGTPAQIADEILKQSAWRAIGLIGHEPGLGEFAAWFIGAKAPLAFRKGGVCRIDVPSLSAVRPGQLRWFATPGMLRRLRET